MSTQPVTTKYQSTPVIDWGELSEVQAIMKLCSRMNIRLGVTPDGKLSATGNPDNVSKYFGDIASRYRDAVIAHLLELPAPEILEVQDSQNIAANCQALDVTIAEYCAAAGHTAEYRERLLFMRRCMAPGQLVQNLCAFRAWLYAVNLGGGNG